ncbi:MAG: hypothetical protein WB611_21030 [Stellaceae bacterium]
MADLDLDKLAVLLGIAGSSVFEGERANAIVAVDKMLRAAGLTWPDLLKPAEQLETATQAAAALLAENDLLRAQLAEAEVRGGALTTWQDVNAAPGDHRRRAAWMLSLEAQGAVWLGDFETRFPTSCTSWTGQLTRRQQPIFDGILTRVIDRTGLRPPP